MGQPILFHVAAITALTNGFAVAAVSSPFDVIKTGIQAGSGNDKPLMKQSLQKFGPRVLFAGIHIKSFQIILGWGLLSFFTQAKERSDKGLLHFNAPHSCSP